MWTQHTIIRTALRCSHDAESKPWTLAWVGGYVDTSVPVTTGDTERMYLKPFPISHKGRGFVWAANAPSTALQILPLPSCVCMVHSWQMLQPPYPLSPRSCPVAAKPQLTHVPMPPSSFYKHSPANCGISIIINTSRNIPIKPSLTNVVYQFNSYYPKGKSKKETAKWKNNKLIIPKSTVQWVTTDLALH